MKKYFILLFSLIFATNLWAENTPSAFLAGEVPASQTIEKVLSAGNPSDVLLPIRLCTTFSIGIAKRPHDKENKVRLKSNKISKIKINVFLFMRKARLVFNAVHYI